MLAVFFSLFRFPLLNCFVCCACVRFSSLYWVRDRCHLLIELKIYSLNFLLSVSIISNYLIYLSFKRKIVFCGLVSVLRADDRMGVFHFLQLIVPFFKRLYWSWFDMINSNSNRSVRRKFMELFQASPQDVPKESIKINDSPCRPQSNYQKYMSVGNSSSRFLGNFGK